MGFLEKTNLLGCLGFIGFWALLVFLIFYLSEQLGSLLVDLAHQLSFYLDSPVLHLKIHKFVTLLLVVRTCKHKEVFSYYWHDKLKLN